MLLLKMGPEVYSMDRRALPPIHRSEKEDGCRPSEFLIVQTQNISDFITECSQTSTDCGHKWTLSNIFKESTLLRLSPLLLYLDNFSIPTFSGHTV